jgi:hypothetical protein
MTLSELIGKLQDACKITSPCRPVIVDGDRIKSVVVDAKTGEVYLIKE